MNFPNIFKEVKILSQQGKLHKTLMNRTRILFFISLVLAGIVSFNIIFRGTHPLIALAIATVGFILGVTVFSRMTPVNWNEEKETVQTGRMDLVGYITIGAYILFEIGLRRFLSHTFPVSSTIYVLSGIFGTLFGRAVGTTVEIHRVYFGSQKNNV